jgi:hypothetical protein
LQSVQLVAAPSENDPGVQVAQAMVPASGAKVPGAQFWQLELAGVALNVPGAHVVHATEPCWAVKVPRAQLRQVELPGVDTKRPGAHGVQVVAPPIENEPGTQGVHGAWPVALNCPGGHC